MKHKETLFDEFPPATAEDWLARINTDLKGEDFNSRLVWKTDEGFDVMPFYMRSDLNNLPDTGVLKETGRWLIRQDIRVDDCRSSNMKALGLTDRGADSLGFIISDPEMITSENIRYLLDNINPESVEINFLTNGKARELLAFIAGTAAERGAGSSLVTGAIETDPAGRLMINGTLCITPEAGFDYLAALVREADILPFYRVIHVNGANFSNAGAGVVQELAFTLSIVCEYMTQLTDRNIPPLHAASKIRLGFGTGSGYFMEIAKLRAARLLWPLIMKGFINEPGDPPVPVVHCQTTAWNKTLYDLWVNMLRTQTETMAAVLGGADSVTVLPFNSSSGINDEFGERIARNQQLILREEALFDRTADPSAGSYYIEALTNLVSEHAWRLFLSVEEKGGFISALRKGFIQKEIDREAAARRDDILNGRKILVGTNKYPDPNEEIVTHPDDSRSAGADFPYEDLLVRPVRLARGAGEIERMRSEKAREGNLNSGDNSAVS